MSPIDHGERTWPLRSIFVAGAAAILAACGTDTGTRASDEFYLPSEEPLTPHEIPTFEEFQAAARVSGVEETLYFVEWDFPIHEVDELRSYYDAMFHSKLAKSAVKLTPSTGTDTGQCNVNPPPSNCVDDKWNAGEQARLRYCVSNDFGTSKSSIVSSMASAASAWKSVANVSFTYVSTNDNACRQTDPLPGTVDFKVAPWTGSGACSFWPKSKRACLGNTAPNLVYNLSSNFGRTMTGVLTHELGHILGFHHEHQRPDAPIFDCRLWELRSLTPQLDTSSVMGYPIDPTGFNYCWLGTSDVLSPGDISGVRQLYGIPPAWMVATAFRSAG